MNLADRYDIAISSGLLRCAHTKALRSSHSLRQRCSAYQTMPRDEALVSVLREANLCAFELKSMAETAEHMGVPGSDPQVQNLMARSEDLHRRLRQVAVDAKADQLSPASVYFDDIVNSQLIHAAGLGLLNRLDSVAISQASHKEQEPAHV
jgi:hypothetical protein